MADLALPEPGQREAIGGRVLLVRTAGANIGRAVALAFGAAGACVAVDLRAIAERTDEVLCRPARRDRVRLPLPRV